MGTVGDPRFRGVNFVKVRGARGLTAHHRSYVEAQLAMHHDPSRRGKNARRMDHDHLPHRAWDASPTRKRDTRFFLVMEQICCRPGAGKFLPRLMREQPRIHPAPSPPRPSRPGDEVGGGGPGKGPRSGALKFRYSASRTQYFHAAYRLVFSPRHCRRGLGFCHVVVCVWGGRGQVRFMCCRHVSSWWTSS